MDRPSAAGTGQGENLMRMANGLKWKLVGLSWLAMVAFDFFLHAGLLADRYRVADPFILPPEQAFARIPLGYLSFFLVAWLLGWVLVDLDRRGGRAGLLFGLQVGALVGGAFVLGLYSIAPAPLWLLVGWFAGQLAEAGIGGLVLGVGLARGRAGRLSLEVLGFLVLALVGGIVLQNI